MLSFDEQVALAASAPFTGWDFRWMNARTTLTRPLPWSMSDEVSALAAGARRMLDLGTGGGEWLSGLGARPERTAATESWDVNAAVAAARLRPLGIPVIRSAPAPENSSAEGITDGPDRTSRLPFRDRVFDLVTARHEAFRADEVSRVMSSGGSFVTQQVDYHNYDDLYDLLGLRPPDYPRSWLPLAIGQLMSAGLEVRLAMSGEQHRRFPDVSTVIYYLRVVSWAVPGHGLTDLLPRLRRASENAGRWPLTVRYRRFLVIATKP